MGISIEVDWEDIKDQIDDDDIKQECIDRDIDLSEFAELERDPRLEQIWLAYRGKEVPQVLADYLWDTIGKAI